MFYKFSGRVCGCETNEIMKWKKWVNEMKSVYTKLVINTIVFGEYIVWREKCFKISLLQIKIQCGFE